MRVYVVFTLLAGSIVACRSGAKDPSREILAGCSRTATPYGAQFRCGSAVASVEEYTASLTPEAVIDGSLGGLRAMAREGESVRHESSTVTLRGTVHPATRLTIEGPDPATGHILARVAGKSTRLVWCIEPSSEPAPRCEAILENFLAHGIPPGSPSSPGNPTFASRPIPVPEGCVVSAWTEWGWRITCGPAATLGWLEVPDVEAGNKLVVEMADMIAKLSPGAKRGQAGCAIGGTATTCTQVDTGSGADRARAELGVAAVGSVTLFAHCTYSPPAEIPAVCRRVFSF